MNDEDFYEMDLSPSDLEGGQETYELELLQWRRVKEGWCPNGCQALQRLDLKTAECPTCGFTLWSNNPQNICAA
jgi:hypothetical protein